jgi:hypothetical protein
MKKGREGNGIGCQCYNGKSSSSNSSSKETAKICDDNFHSPQEEDLETQCL